jgi:hypothetical protein
MDRELPLVVEHLFKRVARRIDSQSGDAWPTIMERHHFSAREPKAMGLYPPLPVGVLRSGTEKLPPSSLLNFGTRGEVDETVRKARVRACLSDDDF